MVDAAVTPRIAPLRETELSAEARECLAESVINDGGVVRRRRDDDPIHPYQATMLRAPKLFKRFGVFAGHVLTGGTLPERDREIICLRTGWLCRGAMEFGEHVAIAHTVGLTTEDIERITHGPLAPGWSPFEAALLSAVDELHAEGHVSDAAWDVLVGVYEEQQLLELPYLVGAYHTVAFAQNTLRISLPEGNLGLAAR